ncbi:hypothetical protein HPB47_004849 [Ixodes persulcatus]|uniref:Uncharacterized protein n=1 Tax=Ixodes persulcatus TaxID=34615 RepID=A0AC60PEZ3_IXOPE|nr:hypothetical protein HPB47_004849 [Ixodes persulcatus]
MTSRELCGRGLIIFEWWYFRKYGTSFIEQVSLNHLSPWLGGGAEEPDGPAPESRGPPSAPSTTTTGECKVWRNPLSLLRGAEYARFLAATRREPLTFYDMNLSAQDHQTLFAASAGFITSHKYDEQRVPVDGKVATTFGETFTFLCTKSTSVTAYILLAEEEAPGVLEAEKLFRQALKYAETNHRKSQPLQHQGTFHEALHRRDCNVLVYVRRRLAMCARKLGKVREAVKMMRDLMKEFPSMNLFNIHENLIEALLELQAYADVQAVLAKYDDINLPKSASICYTAALLKARGVGDKFSAEAAARRGLSGPELAAVEAVHRAVEFNPHVPKYLLEAKSLILPPEHLLKRGDSEALAYAFFHLRHWKRVEGALHLLHWSWEGTFRALPYPLERGQLFYPYPGCTEATDRELLPPFHEVSVYPKKELPFFILFTAGLCSLTALLALLTHQYPEPVGLAARTLLAWLALPLGYLLDKLEALLPSSLLQQLSRI